MHLSAEKEIIYFSYDGDLYVRNAPNVGGRKDCSLLINLTLKAHRFENQ